MFPAAPVEPLVFFVLFFYILFVYSLGCCLHHTCEVFRLWTVSVLLMLLLKGRADALNLERRHLNLLLDSAPLSSFSSESEANQFGVFFFALRNHGQRSVVATASARWCHPWCSIPCSPD